MLGRGLALNAMVIAIATATGPTLAGAILSVASWHWLFIINVPFGIIAFFLGKRLLPNNPGKNVKENYDWVSGLQNALTFGLIFLALGNFAKEKEMTLNCAILVGGLVMGSFYIRRQRHKENPMLPIDLFKIRLYSESIFTSICSFIAQNIAMISLPFLFLKTYGFTEISTGLLMTPWPLATMIVSPIAARFVERHNPGVTAAVGMAVYSVGLLALLFAHTPEISEGGIAWRMAVCGVGFGLFQTPNNIVMVMATPVHRTGAAGGMQSTARLVGQTLGATIVTIVFAIAIKPYDSVKVCLILALIMAVIAGVLSLSRYKGIRQTQPVPSDRN